MAALPSWARRVPSGPLQCIDLHHALVEMSVQREGLLGVIVGLAADISTKSAYASGTVFRSFDSLGFSGQIYLGCALRAPTAKRRKMTNTWRGTCEIEPPLSQVALHILVGLIGILTHLRQPALGLRRASALAHPTRSDFHFSAGQQLSEIPLDL